MHSVLNPEAPEFHPHLNAAVQEGYLHASKTIRTSNTFPIGTSYDLFKTFTDFNLVTYRIRENVVCQSNQIMTKELPCVNLKCHSDEESNTEKIIDANDSLLDRINVNIDTLSGVNRPSEEFARGVQTAAWNRAPIFTTIKVNGEMATLISAKQIPRPQLSFKQPVDNSDQLFVPRISDKPNSIKPLALTILFNEEGQPVGYEHPYKTELDLYEPPAHFLEDDEPPAFPPPLESTPLTIIDTEAQLQQLFDHLDQVQEIAVDLEHHNYRTYQGITCLIQISTDEGGDFIVDALAVRDHLHKLNQSFTDPNKIKVFHGAEHDMQWLQRDFGVYVVGLFDTHQAARLLRLPALSLKYLLSRYCSIEADKTLQMADWRMRPLPDALVQYARSDTHYLLYVWRTMRRELRDAAAGAGLLAAAFSASGRVAGTTYNKPTLNSESHMPLYARSLKQFGAGQLAALRLLFRWRDETAREHDESTKYVLPTHALMQLAELLPQDTQGVLALDNPVPPLLKQNLNTVHRMILSCRELQDEPQVFAMPRSVLGMVAPPPRWLPYGVHDLGPRPEHSSGEEAINLDAAWEVAARARAARARPRADLRAFDEAARDAAPPPPAHLAYLAPARAESNLNAEAQMFVPPYDRYKMYRILSQAEEIRDLKEKEAKVEAISRGNQLIREEVLVKLQQAHAVIEKDTASGDAPPAPPAPPAGDAPSNELDEQKFDIVQKKKGSQRKRKIIEKSEQKDATDQIAENKKTTHKSTNKEDAAVKPLPYKNVNYKKFYSDNDKGHKQPKTKFKRC